MATLILTAVGTAVGGPIGGAIGGLLGGVFDRGVLFKPKGREGPRLSDLHVQTSTYGSRLPQMFGTMRVAGTVIWATDLRETKTKNGGGKGQQSVTSYSYSASFAVALSSRRAVRVARIWADGNLLRGAAGDFKTEVGAFRFHDGHEDQPVDPLIAAAQGMAVTPAHRGIAYAVFEDLALGDFGNRIPSLTFELVADEGGVAGRAIVEGASGRAIAGASSVLIDGYAADGGYIGEALQPLADSLGWLAQADGDPVRLGDGGEDPVEVAQGMIAARLNGKAVAQPRLSRAPAEQVPVRLSLRHYDAARDYQAGVQKAVRPGPGRREDSIDLPAVVPAARAKALAGERLARDWAGRATLEMVCGWEALTLVPGALVRVLGIEGHWRLTDSEWEGQGVRLSLRRVASGAALPSDAASGGGVHQPDLPHGATRLILADLPVLSDAGPDAPVLFVAAAGTSDGWRRAALFTQEAGGAAVAMGSTAPAAVMGTLLEASDGRSALIFDDEGVIEVELLAPGMMLEDADDDSLGRGANLCLLGEELMQFGRAVPLGEGVWRLSRLLRGRRGTEWAMAGHVAGEPFLMIDAERLASVPGEAVHIGAALTVMAIGIGDAVPAEVERVVTGEALWPLSPVHVTAMSDSAGGTIWRWTRRSRSGWRWNDGVEVPIGEESERYAIRVRDGDVLVRSAETGAPEWVYDSAMVAADATAGHAGPLTIEIRQIGTRAVGRPAIMAMA